jgi:hypothetical protein
VRTENITHAFLDGVLDGTHDDVCYHFGVASSDPLLADTRTRTVLQHLIGRSSRSASRACLLATNAMALM